MMLLKEKHFSLYFGSEKDNLRPHGEYKVEKFSNLRNKLAIENVFFLKQTHSADVFVLNAAPEKQIDIFQHEGDAIITDQKNVAIGVVTADCLPVILYDQKNNIISAIHAGWKGLSTKIITKTIQKMRDIFGTHPSHLKAYFGPSAGVCCYEVQADFLTHFPETVFDKNIIEKREGKFYFNERLSGLFELLENNVLKDNIDVKNNLCTICQPGFCSARKQKEKTGRQPSIVFLH